MHLHTAKVFDLEQIFCVIHRQNVAGNAVSTGWCKAAMQVWNGCGKNDSVGA